MLPYNDFSILILRGGSRTAATSKMERFVIKVNNFQPLTIITKHSILDVPAVLDPPLIPENNELNLHRKESLMIKKEKLALHQRCFLHNNISYFNVCICIIRAIVLLTNHVLYENLRNSKSL